ncbi:hypothetical protein AAG906_003157 [Vitis piasezkii]
MARTRGAKSSSRQAARGLHQRPHPRLHIRASATTAHPPPPSQPSSEPQPSQPPPLDSQIPSGMTPEVLIRRPMLTQPPIEGNLGCRLGLSTRALLWRGHFRTSAHWGLLPSAPEAHSEALRIPYEPARLEDYRVGLILPEQYSSYYIRRGIHRPVSPEEGAPS